MIKKLIKTVRGFAPVELVIMVGFGALAAAALIYLGTTPHYMASSQPVNVNVKVDGSGATVSRQASAKANESTGNMWIVDASGNGDYTDIQSAINDASSGDTIMVMPGTYAGAELTKQVELVGDDGVYITAGPYGAYGFFMWGHDSDGSTIRNFSFDGVDFPVYLDTVDNITVSHLKINNFIEGIVLWDSTGSTITHNTLTASVAAGEDYQQNGISLATWAGSANNNLIAFNSVTYNGPTPTGYFYGNWGIHLAAFPDTQMESNKIVHNKMKFATGQWFSGGLGVGDASVFYGGEPVIKNNYFGFNDTRGSTTWEAMFFAVSMTENTVARNLGATWYTDNPFLGEYTNLDTGENRSVKSSVGAPANPSEFKPHHFNK